MPGFHLRVYHGPGATPVAAESIAPETSVRLRLGQILPLLADAVRCERTWLSDFADDEVSISADLYEVLLAYQHCLRPSA